MATYRFQCEACGLSFTARGAPDVKEAKCECGKPAKRTLPQGTHIAVSGGNADLRTDTVGLSGIDYNFDRAVGESSKKTWQGIAGRQRDKLDIVQANGVTGWDLSRNPDGTYRVMNAEERAASERSRGFHFNMVNHAKNKGLK
jgi:hypothetical protein